MPKTDTTKFLVEQAVSQLRATATALASLKREMQSLAASLPEHPVVMEMFGVGPALGPQLMAEIGDVRRFHSKKALVAFAGIDAPPYQSGPAGYLQQKHLQMGFFLAAQNAVPCNGNLLTERSGR